MTPDERKKLQQQAARAMKCVWDKYDGTKEQLAESIDVDVSTLYRWANGERVIRGSNAVKLSEETGLEKAEFRPDLFSV